ncbi:hypothetical protein KJ854_02830 [Patescibacteria group bacterium]|nr:hypothetical protein [Patescibacteria group bacterium]
MFFFFFGRGAEAIVFGVSAAIAVMADNVFSALWSSAETAICPRKLFFISSPPSASDLLAPAKEITSHPPAKMPDFSIIQVLLLLELLKNKKAISNVLKLV